DWSSDVCSSDLEGRCDPASTKREIICIKMKTVVLQEFWKRHAPGFEIIEQRRALSLRQRLRAARNEHARLFKQLARRATNHRARLRLNAILHARKRIRRITLPA